MNAAQDMVRRNNILIFIVSNFAIRDLNRAIDHDEDEEFFPFKSYAQFTANQRETVNLLDE